ncbi:MAG: hypothetical protein ACLRVT_06595 [Oscillospiraceae bacterium]
MIERFEAVQRMQDYIRGHLFEITPAQLARPLFPLGTPTGCLPSI